MQDATPALPLRATVDREVTGARVIVGSVAVLVIALFLSLSVGATGVTLSSLPRAAGVRSRAPRTRWSRASS